MKRQLVKKKQPGVKRPGVVKRMPNAKKKPGVLRRPALNRLALTKLGVLKRLGVKKNLDVRRLGVRRLGVRRLGVRRLGVKRRGDSKMPVNALNAKELNKQLRLDAEPSRSERTGLEKKKVDDVGSKKHANGQKTNAKNGKTAGEGTRKIGRKCVVSTLQH